MTDDNDPMPVTNAIQAVIENAIAAGMSESDAIDECFGVAVGGALAADGAEKTAKRLLIVARALTEMVPPADAPMN